MTLSEELTWRGFVNQTTYSSIEALNTDPVTFYWGVDPTADSMTIGNLAAAMMVKCFIKHGHNPVLLVGGATGMVGDPDGKREERTLKTTQELIHNKAAIAAEYTKIFEGYDFKLVDNYDWFTGMQYLDFLRTVGKHVPMRQMLAREFVQSRLGEGGSGISYAEFSYVLIQAYDFLHLQQNYNVSLQLCGSDQWGNSIAGVDLIRRVTGKETHVYSTPLIVNKATGVKFGKSEAGAIWLDTKKTSPSSFYQFWINLDDEGLAYYLKIYTELDKEQIDGLMAVHATNPGARYGQTRLASAVTTLIHGSAAVTVAEQVTEYLRGTQHVGNANDQALAALSAELAHALSNQTGEIAVALLEAGLASSKSDARRLLQNKAVYINGQSINREYFEASDFTNGRCLIRRGKSLKDSALITVN